eukprot:TRINITY_DN5959_c0_g2_i2.p2 TRINITY_DN5959_c0_g2~~TRINITY_DN5959_c0_g2_i2.p2  ORF type:complete len:196 (+),score=47.80 TRINITY_DN5959_c0_g2_i2:61-588(+)
MVEIYIPKKQLVGELQPTCREEADDLPDDLDALRDLELVESEKIFHLERSNRELLEALEAGEDADFRDAVQDNEQILIRKYSRVACIREKIDELRGALAALGQTEQPAAARAPPQNLPTVAELPQQAPATAVDTPAMAQTGFFMPGLVEEEEEEDEDDFLRAVCDVARDSSRQSL